MIKIRGGYYSGRETTWLKQIQLRRPPGVAPPEIDLAPSLAYSTSEVAHEFLPPKARREVSKGNDGGEGQARVMILNAGQHTTHNTQHSVHRGRLITT